MHARPSTDTTRPASADPARLVEETEYNVVARRNLLLGLEIGRRVGHPPDALHDYAGRVIAADHQRPGHEDVLEFLTEDLRRRGIALAEGDLVALMRDAERMARLHFAATD